jgi:hypothetical protein
MVRRAKKPALKRVLIGLVVWLWATRSRGSS